MRDQARGIRDREKIDHVGVTAQELTRARSTINNIGEALGTLAGQDAIAHYFPATKFDSRALLPDDIQGSGVFDNAVLITERSTGRSQIIIVENKGPRANLVSRIGLDGKRYEQGTQGCYESTDRSMMNSRIPAVRDAADAILLEARKGCVSYRLVQAKLDKDGADWLQSARV